MDPTPRDDLPAELRAFLYACVDAIEQVEILMLLRRSGRASTARDVTQALALSEQLTRVHLETLTSRGLLSATPGREVVYRCEPKTPALARYVDLLADHYGASRNAIHTFIATFARRSRSFAAAFRLRDREE